MGNMSKFPVFRKRQAKLNGHFSIPRGHRRSCEWQGSATTDSTGHITVATLLYSYCIHTTHIYQNYYLLWWMQLLSLIKMKLAPSFISVSRPQRTTEDFSFIITLMLLQCLSFCLADSFGHCNWIIFLTEDNIQAKLLFFIILFICWLTV